MAAIGLRPDTDYTLRAMLKPKELSLILLITLLALAVRLPYWQTIPAASDEVAQATYALQIARGEKLPLVANDQYDGPIFVYFMAVLFRLGMANPLLGRAVILTTGTLLAPLTYWWVRRLRGTLLAGLVAAGIVISNPHLVLINSHIGGTTQLLPFFTTLFLLLLTTAVETDQPGWLIAAGAAGGLALQTNLAGVLLIAGAGLWLTWHVRQCARLGRRWPLWPVLTGLALLAVYSPVIIHNILLVRLGTVTTLQQRSYLWETNPTVFTLLNNWLRLGMQFTRQISGVALGREDFQTIAGWPLLYAGWALAGMVYLTRRVSRLPLACFPLFVLIVPAVSSHFGILDPVRFTTPFTPIFAAGMGFTAAWVWEQINRRVPAPMKRRAQGSLVAMLAAAILFPLAPLSQYYDYVNVNHYEGAPLLALSREMVAANRGEPVYIGFSEAFRITLGIPYLPELHLIMAGIPHSLLPPNQIIGQLFAGHGPAMLLLDDAQAATIERAAHLIPWPSAANQAAHAQGFGLYTLDTATPLEKPDFVLTLDRLGRLPPKATMDISVGGNLKLIGYDLPDHIAPGQTLTLTLYWRNIGPMPEATYMGFAHLFDTKSMQLLAQDDHILGHDQYPVNAWQLNDIVVDRYALPLSANATPASIIIQIGAYTWPDTQRLNVPGNPDNQVMLKPVSVTK